MDGKLNIVPGEAPESDDEDAQINQNPVAFQGTAFEGEAPESDSSASSQVDDIDYGQRASSTVSASSAASSPSLVLQTDNTRVKTTNYKEDVQYSSLLHKKLRERNASLRRSVEDFVHHNVETAARDLNSIDQHLLKSQVTLQETATSLRLLQSNLSQTYSKLASATSSTYLPIINIKNL